MSQTYTLKSILSDNRSLRRLIWLILAALIILTVAFAGYYYWDRYVHLGDKSPIEMSTAHLEDQVRTDPSNPDARLALAEQYLQNQEFAGAMEQAQQVLNAFPDHPGALLILGVANTMAGNAQAAIEPLEQFAALRRDDPMAGVDTNLEAALYYLGYNYISINQPTQAIPVLSEALVIEPTDADAMFQLGIALAREGQHAQAIAQFYEAVRFVPDFADAYQEMAASYGAMDMPAHVLYAHGMQAFSNKSYDQARDLLEQAAGELSDFAPLYLGLALTYEQLGDLQLAQTNVERTLALEPHNFYANIIYERLQTSDD
jgi:tetratricopeptide (TPR) repeat protein